jgi:hypothetical protein
MRIAIAQSKGGGAGAEANMLQDGVARGADDFGTDKKAPEQEKKESRDHTLDEKGGKSKVRGEGK